MLQFAFKLLHISVQVGVLAFNNSGSLLASGGLDGAPLPAIGHSQPCKRACTASCCPCKILRPPAAAWR